MVVAAVKALSLLSTSVLVRDPAAVRASLVSVSTTESDDTVAASFLPLIVIVTVAGALSISLLSDAMYSKTTSVVSPSPSDWKLLPKL